MNVRNRLIAVASLTVLMFGVGSVAQASVSAKQKVDPCAALGAAGLGDTLGGEVGVPTPSGTDACSVSVTRTIPNGTASTNVFFSIGKYKGIAKKDVTIASKVDGAVKIKGIKGAKLAFYDLSQKPPTATIIKGKDFLNLQMTELEDAAATAAALTALAKSITTSVYT